MDTRNFQSALIFSLPNSIPQSLQIVQYTFGIIIYTFTKLIFLLRSKYFLKLFITIISKATGSVSFPGRLMVQKALYQQKSLIAIYHVFQRTLLPCCSNNYSLVERFDVGASWSVAIPKSCLGP